VSKFDKNKDETVKLVCDPKEAILNGLEQESSTQKLIASWASVIAR